MGQLPIIQLGNPTLRQKAAPVGFNQLKSKEIRQLINDLKETLIAEDGIGLAANQVNKTLRIIAVTIPPELLGHKTTGIPLQALINPKIISASEKIVEDWEGCLSFNFLRGLVPRHQSVTVEAWNEKGETITIEAYDLFAQVLQHEIDHLDGILYIDRMTDMKTLMSTEEFKKIYKEEIVAK